MQFAKIHSSVWDNPKFLSLPSDSTKLALFRVWSAGKVADPQFRWPSLEYLSAALRGDPWAIPHLDALVTAGLLVTADDGWIEVHDWRKWQLYADKRPAEQLAAEAPAVLEKRQKDDARRKRIAYWIGKMEEGLVDIDDVPEEVRPEVRSRFSAEISADTHGHTHSLRKRVSIETETESPVGDSAVEASSRPSPYAIGRDTGFEESPF